MQIPKDLIEQYNVPAPRYTSYPTVPMWDKDSFSVVDWKAAVKETFDQSNEQEGISLYVHLPYCESLCTYCACNTRITKNHGVEAGYIDSLLAEWKLYREMMGAEPQIAELHLGGGTPTFFAPENLSRLISGLLEGGRLHPEAELSFEGHPNNTTAAHLQALYDLGFRRVSYGVQDLNRKVQVTINRLQPLENVRRAVREAREIGYDSVNMDLIYGLPFQTPLSVAQTIAEVLQMRPDRIAYYSYAHVPWKRPGQRAYTEADLPTGEMKRALYEQGKTTLLAAGYEEVGMDHFALSKDALSRDFRLKRLHRNFMGYTTSHSKLLIGLGASAISDAHGTYAQNEKGVEAYQRAIGEGRLACTHGHLATEEDQIIRQWMLDLTCRGELDWREHRDLITLTMLIDLHRMQGEGLIQLYEQGLRVTELGMAFIRNICMVFDKRMFESITSRKGKQTFSSAV